MRISISLLFIFLFFSMARAEWEPPAEMLEEIRLIESLPPREAIERCQKYAGAEGLGDQAKARLARNSALISWLPQYFQETPVLFENYAERRSIIITISGLSAEWAVRFLLELSLDERPMKSTRFDYDDPGFQEKMKKAQESLDDGDDTGNILFERYGYGPPGGDNRTLAFDGLRLVREKALLVQERAGVKNPSAPGLTGLSSDSARVAEVVKGMWGEKAILNQELGLGVDNSSISVGSATSAVAERGRRGGLPMGDADAAEKSGSPAMVTKKASKYALFLACGLLAAALAAVGWRRMKAG